MIEPGFRFFYRLVRSAAPVLEDFTPAALKGGPRPSDPARLAVWDGLSVFSTLAQARRKQRTSPILGAYVAVLRVPTDGSVRFERTLGGDGHHTLWDNPASLMAMVVTIEPL